MVEGKPYRYGLIVAGLCVVAVGLFVMSQERPHIYITMCILGVAMVCLGTTWSLCQCYPKVVLAQVQEKCPEAHSAAEDKRPPVVLLDVNDRRPGNDRLLSKAQMSQYHSCPTMHLVGDNPGSLCCE
ncbi:barttin [Cynoglossus semilaevis]|uniref:barttin n=1 Tax=Cynoglossus semilaevis TaxID=244447 RepID=UPI00049573D6|nr:barttin [Cynoglossus semilaevis]